MPITFDKINTSGPVVIVCKDIAFAFPFGIAYIAGYLKDHGERPVVMFRSEDPSKFEAFADEIISHDPLVVAFGSLYPDLYPTRDLVAIMDRKKRRFPVVVGGQMVSPTPEFSVDVTGAEIGVVGEGEIVFHELVTALRNGRPLSDVRGIVYREGKDYIFTGHGDFIRDLSLLPKIPYELFPSEKWLNIGRYYVNHAQPHWRYADRVVSIHGGRGCPFKCNFCYHHSKPRYRKISEMMVEASELMERYRANVLYFGDDLVLASPKRATELTEHLETFKRKVEYSVSCRFDILSRIDDGLLREMKRTGCRIMGLGIESGSQRILDAMGKRITVEQIREGLSRLKKVGILPTVSIMFGQHTETAEDARRSIELMLDTVRENRNIQYAFTVTTPFPGSALYDMAKEKRMLEDDMDFFKRFDPAVQMGGVTLNVSEMDDATVEGFRREASDLFESERDRLRGPSVRFLEDVRAKMAHKTRRLREKFGDRIKIEPLYRAAELFNDAAQYAIDRVRLRLLGL